MVDSTVKLIWMPHCTFRRPFDWYYNIGFLIHFLWYYFISFATSRVHFMDSSITKEQDQSHQGRVSASQRLDQATRMHLPACPSSAPEWFACACNISGETDTNETSSSTGSRKVSRGVCCTLSAPSLGRDLRNCIAAIGVRKIQEIDSIYDKLS